LSSGEIAVFVQVREATGKVQYELTLKDSESELQDLLVAVADQSWGERLFRKADGEVELRPGHILALDNRMIQPWEIENTRIRDGQTLNFVPVVAGG
jgi:molybdopterin converting factor small subunit